MNGHGDSTAAVVDATDADHAWDALSGAAETLVRLELVNDETPSETIVPAEAVPFALTPQ